VVGTLRSPVTKFLILSLALIMVWMVFRLFRRVCLYFALAFGNTAFLEGKLMPCMCFAAIAIRIHACISNSSLRREAIGFVS